MTVPDRFAAAVRRWLDRDGLTPAEAAARLTEAGHAVSDRTVMGWRNGRVPAMRDLDPIAAAAGCDPADLIAEPK
ncbi:hypothetical protein [Alienimonas sp. DA493]|uniref:hypothetical protein n=1 Tax=Alienimonas sp. DA493 TaxID=3373605 RepID=UPI0037547619